MGEGKVMLLLSLKFHPDGKNELKVGRKSLFMKRAGNALTEVSIKFMLLPAAESDAEIEEGDLIKGIGGPLRQLELEQMQMVLASL
jgi:hypothetical protein